MKQIKIPLRLLQHLVAPRAGAWIETSCRGSISTSWKVAPRAGAWIETINGVDSITSGKVAPRAGAWIETLDPKLIVLVHHVAPRAGAWIETVIRVFVRICIVPSLPARERGLKHKGT